jgi:hypothetical protein
MKKYSSSSPCPVPIEQQPMYEYENLKKSIFFSWTTENLLSYLKTLVSLITLTYAIVGTFVIISDGISFELNSLQSAIFVSLIVDILIILLFVRISLGWEYIYKRLKNATVSYEESGWYDGQMWIKSPDVLIKDKLTADYVLFPIIKRIKTTLNILVTYLSFVLLINKLA